MLEFKKMFITKNNTVNIWHNYKKKHTLIHIENVLTLK